MGAYGPAAENITTFQKMEVMRKRMMITSIKAATSNIISKQIAISYVNPST
jgi:hypothetical protein